MLQTAHTTLSLHLNLSPMRWSSPDQTYAQAKARFKGKKEKERNQELIGLWKLQAFARPASWDTARPSFFHGKDEKMKHATVSRCKANSPTPKSKISDAFIRRKKYKDHDKARGEGKTINVHDSLLSVARW